MLVQFQTGNDEQKNKMLSNLGQLNRVTGGFRVVFESSIHLRGFHFLAAGTLPELCLL